MCRRFLHLDFKGIVPKIQKIHEWLVFFRKCGFHGIVFEFDCRVKWQTWEHAGMPVYSVAEAKQIVAEAEALGFETIPLMQVQGHLEWILGEDAYAHLRENGTLTLCPSHPDSSALLGKWMEELREIFPHSHYLHLGADEVEFIGECRACRAKAEKIGRHGIYRAHVAACCRKALDLGFRPMLWGDMLLHDTETPGVAIPAETIIVDWQYWGAGPFESTERLRKSGHEVWGASSIKCAWYEHFHMMLNYPQERLENVLGWNRFKGNVIHTNWGRPGNKWNLYPPWHMSIPVFVAAGDPAQWAKHPWNSCFTRFMETFRRGLRFQLENMLPEMKTWPCSDAMEQECLRYLCLGVEYELLAGDYFDCLFGKCAVDAAIPYIGRNIPVYKKYFLTGREKLHLRLEKLMQDVDCFFLDNELLGKEEFIAEKTSIFRL